MGFSEGQEKVVASANDPGAFADGSVDSVCRRISDSAVYLYAFLDL